MVEWIIDAIREVFWWILDMAVGVALPVLEAVIDALPDEYKTAMAANIGELTSVLAFVDHWFPVVEVVGMLLLYWTFRIAFGTVRFVIGLFPGVAAGS